MTTSTYAPAQQAPFGQYQSPFDQTALYQQQFGWSPYGAQATSPYMSPYGLQATEQVVPTIALVVQQLANAQQCVWTAQHLLAQIMPQTGQIPQLQGQHPGQFGQPFGQQFGQPFGQQFGQFGQRQLPRQYSSGW
jgi:hypothetical protein